MRDLHKRLRAAKRDHEGRNLQRIAAREDARPTKERPAYIQEGSGGASVLASRILGAKFWRT